MAIILTSWANHHPRANPQGGAVGGLLVGSPNRDVLFLLLPAGPAESTKLLDLSEPNAVWERFAWSCRRTPVRLDGIPTHECKSSVH